MTFSLHAAIIPSQLQILRACAGLIDKAEAFCLERDLSPDTLVQARLAEDMLPFAYQVKSSNYSPPPVVGGTSDGEGS
uniref:DUF1993 family protein n=1 Tax=uncultured Sphingomonas sp. TaxID=158754 RepID=UPI0035C9D607